MTIHHFKGIEAVYATDKKSGITTFTVLPSGMADRILEEKVLCSYNRKYGHIHPEPMFQAAFLGDSPTRVFSAGISMRNAETALRLRVIKQETIRKDGGREVITYLEDTERGIRAEHHVRQEDGFEGLECWNTIVNTGKEDKTLEFIDSFSVSCISPFVKENDPDKILLHRIRNYWSGEGRKESLPVSKFAMEDTWSCYGYRMERFGQVGTMPARGFLPFVAMEDLENGVVWAASMDAPASWQIEAGHHTCGLHLSGGLADYNFGHWRKTLSPGESFTTHSAFLAAVRGGLLDACQVLTEYQKTRLRLPPSEEELPVVYNEYLCSNGSPTLKGVAEQIPFCRECGVRYFVIDDGWYTDPEKRRSYLGNWVADGERFPGGLEKFVALTKENGMKAGVWYEFENVTEGAPISRRKDWMHTRDGVLIRHENRIFPDFRKKEVTDFLAEQVIGELKRSGIGYVKIDYNENIGLGVDGAESIGEGLRQHMEKVLEFYRRILREVPDLVMEICSSGGLRHEPLFISLGSMVSFSDLHEVPEGAVTACDLHRALLPRQMQVWASIRPEYGEERVYFTMAEGMLGRLCLSGDLASCSDSVKEIVKEGTAFYEKIKYIVKDGRTVAIDTDKATSLSHLHAAFSLTRLSRDGKNALFYAFRVRGEEREIFGKLPGKYRAVAQYGRGRVETNGNTVTVFPTDAEIFASVVLLEEIN